MDKASLSHLSFVERRANPALASEALHRVHSTSDDALRGATTWAPADAERAAETGASDQVGLPAPGAVLDGSYRIEHLLAQGAMGAVYLATDLQLDRAVAVKVLLPQRADDAHLAQLFIDEARAMARVRHTNVVQVFATGLSEGLPFFVMEYVPGLTVAAIILQSRRQRQPTSLDTVCEILGQAAQGLTAIHESALFHGDVKPANMLITSGFHLAISDFGLVGSAKMGLSVLELAASEPKFAGGTPIYIAPELLCGVNVRPDMRYLSDVYSLGVSVFELLTGHGPFEGQTVRDVLHGHLHLPPPRVTASRPDLPLQVNAIMARALAKEPRQRFQGCIQFAAELSQLAHRVSRRNQPPFARRRYDAQDLRPHSIVSLAPRLCAATFDDQLEPPVLPDQGPDDR